ncbi:unnamed protein product [Ectocarpus sp. CCAP 1310/34]|nr:unnamed protein product [Ectocarpus sp. CCAP 1310/34]
MFTLVFAGAAQRCKCILIRPALQVFGFDPAVSTSPRNACGMPNASSPEGVGDTRLLSPYHHPVIMRSLEEAALTTGGGAADVPPVPSVQ